MRRLGMPTEAESLLGFLRRSRYNFSSDDGKIYVESNNSFLQYNSSL